MKIVFSIALVLLVASAMADPPSTAKIIFAGKAFSLQHQSTTENEVLDEYILPNENIMQWTELIAVRVLPSLTDVDQAVAGLITALKKQNPDAQFAIARQEGGSAVCIDFLTWDMGGAFAEFNVVIYKPNPDSPGLLIHQYAQRAYQEDIKLFMIQLKTKRPQWVQQTVDYKFPKLVERRNGESTSFSKTTVDER
jgi:hypothetical protein